MPITRPRFVLAPDAVELPVPPWATAISVADQTPELSVPTEVRTEFTTVFPKPVLLNTATPSILKCFVPDNSICSDDVQESVESIPVSYTHLTLPTKA